MSAHRLGAGQQAYYTRTVAAGDVVRGAGRAAAAGTPPGVWMGRGAALIGVAGTADTEQLRALFELGVHPDAARIITEETRSGASKRQALRAARLGPAFPRLPEGSALSREIDQTLELAQETFGRPLTAVEAQRVRMRVAARAFTEEFGRTPADGAELGRFLASRSGPGRQPTAGFGLDFLPPGSVQWMWALGDPATAEVIEGAHTEALNQTLAWLEEHALAVRTGPGGIAQLDAEPALIAVRFRHFDNREGMPLLHDHVLISARVKGPSGWRNLDSRLLFRQAVAASELYNLLLMEKVCSRLGVRSVPVASAAGRRPVMEIAGIPGQLLRSGSGRAAAIRTRTGELSEDYRARYGRSPSAAVRYRLQQRAAYETRPDKRQAVALPRLRARWRAHAAAAVGGRTAVRLLDLARAAARSIAPVPERIDVAAAAVTVVEAVIAHRAVFQERHVLAEARRHLGVTRGGTLAPAGAAEQITAEVLRTAVDLSPPALTPGMAELERADGTSIYRPRTYPTYTTAAILRAEDRLLSAARTPVIPPVSRERFAKTARRHGKALDAGQRALAGEFACSERLLLAGIGPAGSGKTEAMKLVAAAVAASGGRLVALAPSARAAQVLAGSLGGRAHTLHAWLERRERPTDTNRPRPVPAGYELRPGDVVVVDEAGMAGTLMLERVLADAQRAGAVVRLLGDPAQLAAVEAGGALRLVAREEGAVRLEQLHRFTTPGEGEASLALREGPAADAFTWYRAHGRIVGGDQEAMLQEVFAAWSRDVAAGRTSLMCAPETATVTALNARAQKARIAAGQVRPARFGRRRRRVRGRDGLPVHAGDVIVTRMNNRRHLLRGGRDFVKNGDVWRVRRVAFNGDLIVVSSSHRGRTRLPAAYVRTSVELGYAATVHRAQGITVDTCHTLISDRTNRQAAYVAATRGRRTNRLYVACGWNQSMDEVLQRIAGSAPAGLSAHETLAQMQDQAASVGQQSAEYADAADRATRIALQEGLRAHLGPYAEGFLAADAFPALARIVNRAADEGWDLRRLLAETIPRRGFGDAEDVAAILHWRIRRRLAEAAEHLAAHAEQPRPLAGLTRDQLQAAADTADRRAQTALHAINAARAEVRRPPRRVTTTDGKTHSAWNRRLHGALSDRQAADALHAARRAVRTALAERDLPAQLRAAADQSNLRAEIRLRDTTRPRDRAREDWQREHAHSPAAPAQTADQPPADPGGTAALAAADATPPQTLAAAEAAWRRARVICARIDAERRIREALPDHRPHQPDDSGPLPDWLADRHILTHPNLPDHWRTHLLARRAAITSALKTRGTLLADRPAPWTTALGPVPATGHRLRPVWENTAALAEAWRTRHAVPAHLTGIGPCPEPERLAAAWSDLAARIRELSRATHALAAAQQRAGDPATWMQAAHHRLDRHHQTPPAAPPPAADGALPLMSAAAADAAYAEQALEAMLAGGPAPEPWMDELPLPDADDTDQRQLWTRLARAVMDWRRRRHLEGADPLGARPHDSAPGSEWEHLGDALNFYRQARIESRLRDITARRRPSAPPSPRGRPPSPPAPRPRRPHR